MAGTAAAHKHTELEEAMAELARAQAQTQAELRRYAKDNRDAIARSEASLERYAAKTDANLDRLSAEMRERAARSEAEWKEFRRMLGEQANRQGRLVEDVLAPSIPDVFRAITRWSGHVDAAVRQSRLRRFEPGTLTEFDGVAWAGQYFLLIEIKSYLRPNDVADGVKGATDIRDFFPEAQDRKVLAAVASFAPDRSLVPSAERRGLYVLGLTGGLIEVLNSAGFKPTEF